MIPQRIMMEILLTGQPITAQRAYVIGLVNRISEPAARARVVGALRGSVRRQQHPGCTDVHPGCCEVVSFSDGPGSTGACGA
jgi:hypothetical protein